MTVISNAASAATRNPVQSLPALRADDAAKRTSWRTVRIR